MARIGLAPRGAKLRRNASQLMANVGESSDWAPQGALAEIQIMQRTFGNAALQPNHPATVPPNTNQLVATRDSAPALRSSRASHTSPAPKDDLFFQRTTPLDHVQRTPAVHVQQRNMSQNRISTKRQLMHLDFVKMKRQDKDIKGIIAKQFPAAEKLLYRKGNEPAEDLYGHYWTEIGSSKGSSFTPEKSFGWWPDDSVSFAETFKGVPGVLNRGDSDHDPHEGDSAPVEFHPAMEVDPEVEDYAAFRSRVTSEIENFARGYKGKWHWRLGWGKNCITFQKSMKSKVGLHFQKGKGWLRAPDANDNGYDDSSADKEGADSPVKHTYEDDASNASAVHDYEDEAGTTSPGKHAYNDDASNASAVHDYEDEAGTTSPGKAYDDGGADQSSIGTATPAAPPQPEMLGPKTKYGEDLKKSFSYANENVDSMSLVLGALFKVPLDQLTKKFSKEERAKILKRNGWQDEDITGFESTLTAKVKYLDDDERMAYQLALGSIIRRGVNPKPYDTTESYTNGIGKSHAIFVMDGLGTFFTGDHKVGAFHHSSFLAGGNVAAAGSIKVEGGRLKEISNKSGHYTPSNTHLRMAISEMKEKGVSISSAKVRSYNPKSGDFDQLDEADAFLKEGKQADKQNSHPLSIST